MINCFVIYACAYTECYVGERKFEGCSILAAASTLEEAEAYAEEQRRYYAEKKDNSELWGCDGIEICVQEV